MIVTPSTELDAVNEILSSIGSSPVDTLDENTALNVDIINAKRILEGVSREIQSRGYDFNTSDNMVLLSDSETGLIPCPYSYLGFYQDGYKFVRKDGYFFDMVSKTAVFPEGITLTIIEEVPFDELPEVFRKFVTVRASRIFQERYLTSEELNQHLMMEEASAYADVLDYDLMAGDYNIFEDDINISQNIQRG